jgi:prepilin-type N-terminal cleavage/methylation domain-containing protein
MKSRGFTLIELLVVIAIIGILSSVVLASLTTARQKGSDAAIQSELANMRAQAELFYGQSGGNTYGIAYSGPCPTTAGSGDDMFSTSTTVTGSLANLATDLTTKAVGNQTMCVSTGVAWAVAASTSAGTWCVDSTGVSRLSSGPSPDAACQ